MNIISEKNNPLLNRRELLIDISFTDKTPTKVEVQKQIATAQKVDEKLIVVKDIIGVYGDRRAKVTAFIYENEKALKDIEPKEKKKKQGEKPAKKPAQAPKQEKKKEEAPKEAPKAEEKPAEEKK